MATLTLSKLTAKAGNPVQYLFSGLSGGALSFPPIGAQIELEFTGKIYCIHCGKSLKKTYGEGYCFPCFTTVPETDECVLRPELCMAHEGIARDMKWAEGHCLQPHYVYLAWTGALKVGVTRVSNTPTRWLDQGADAAIVLAQTPNRHVAGEIEVHLKSYLSDKTNWRKMLQEPTLQDYSFLLKEKWKLSQVLLETQKPFIHDSEAVHNFCYPITKYPIKPQQLNLDRDTSIHATLIGIKGQYLLFDNDAIFNVRRHTGYEVNLFWEGIGS